MGVSVWFESWDRLFKILVSTFAGYLLLILYIRIAGKRATSKMNNFDWIVTVAVGSVLASLAVTEDVKIADGALAMGLLLGLQLLLTAATARWEWARNVFLSPATVLYLRGQFHDAEMLKHRVARTEIIAAIRQSGAASLEEVEAVILESDANLSIVKAREDRSLETVKSVRGFDELQRNSD